MNRTAVVAYSGGLDTSCILAWLKEEPYGFDEVVAVLVDVGQAFDLEESIVRAAAAGAEDVLLVDRKDAFAEEQCARAIATGCAGDRTASRPDLDSRRGDRVRARARDPGRPDNRFSLLHRREPLRTRDRGRNPRGSLERAAAGAVRAHVGSRLGACSCRDRCRLRAWSPRLAGRGGPTQELVTGDVRLELRPNAAVVTGRRSPHMLYAAELASYATGETFPHEAAEGFIRISSLETELHAARKRAKITV